ncbi:MAG: alpha/beta fold hydrolase [Streptosporangiales bacterium]
MDNHENQLETESPAAIGTTGTVTVAGDDVTVRCTGSPTAGEPAVVLLAGMPDDLTTFDGLQSRLGEVLYVCTYDRLGEGTSSTPHRDQSLEDCAATLHGVLAKIAPTGPIVLAGHSLGGLIATVYAHQYPDYVSGLVLLDATAPGVDEEILELVPADATWPAAAVRQEANGLRTGANPERLVYGDTPLGSLGDIPLTVVQHDKSILATVPQYGAQLERICRRGQQRLAALSSRCRLVTATGSGHYVHIDRPDLANDLITLMAR